MARAVRIPPESERPVEQKSVPELISQVVQESSELIQKEFRLLREELSIAIQQAFTATAIIAAGAIVLILGAGYLGAALILLLALTITPWISALIVSLVFLIVGAIAVYAGIGYFNRMKIAPRTVETLKEDTEWLRHPTRLEEK